MNDAIKQMTEKAQSEAQTIVVDAMNTIVNALEAAREKEFVGEWTDEEFQHSRFYSELDRLNDQYRFTDIARRLNEMKNI